MHYLEMRALSDVFAHHRPPQTVERDENELVG